MRIRLGFTLMLLSCAVSAATRGWQTGESSVGEARFRLAAGGSHTCVAHYDGLVRCWGSNVFGQLGTGGTTDSAIPVVVQEQTPLSGQTMRTAIAVAAGRGFNCALKASGDVFCWGQNSSGQLGQGDTDTRSRAVPVPGLAGVVRIAAGQGHACALLANGTMKCWGENRMGQIGDGTGLDRPSPVTVPLSGVVDMALGLQHTCALMADTGVRCWGANANGQLGDNTTVSRTSPVASLASGVSIHAGGSHTCSVNVSRNTVCWGRNSHGQLGTGDQVDRLRPDTLSNLSGEVIEAGDEHTCQLEGGRIQCFGSNTHGQLGDGTLVDRPLPVSLVNPAQAIALAGGTTHTCALLADGTAWCWGRGSSGQLGNGVFADSAAPVPVTNLVGGSHFAKSVVAGRGYTCALRADGTVACWGNNAAADGFVATGLLGNGSTAPQNVTAPVTVPGLTDAVAISAEGLHTCAILASGGLRCWGGNFFGALGLGDNVDRVVPTQVPGLAASVRAVHAGSAHTCRQELRSVLSCHGRNHFGQIGTGTAGVPAINENMLLAESFGLGQDHSCAIQFGTVKCWGVGSGTGDTSAGGNASVATPTPVAGLGPMTALFSGGVVSCAAGSQGTVRCWGRNEMGQTGTGLVGTVLAPTLAPALANPVQIAPGTAHGCALDSRGLFRCWGDNTNGAVGNGAFSTTPVRVPQVIPGLAFGTAIATSPTHSCAVLATGAVRCWGANGSGQLGNGTFVHSATPVSVATFFP